MIEIYINNNKLDIDNKVSITLNLTNEDWSNPTAIKNGFSKTITFPGTKNNNQVFGDTFNVMATNNLVFDSSAKNDTLIFNDGIFIESGYIVLDSVRVKGNTVEYNTTFYSTLGQFFYNLKYKDNGLTNEDDEKTLADLYYGFEIDGTILTPEQEDVNILFNWNAEYIHNSWDSLFGNSLGFKTYSGHNILNNITAAPTYSGYYDDFDSDKVLIYNASETSVKPAFDNGDADYTSKWNSSMTYAGNWSLFEMPRELDEWEVGSLRSLYQRPAIRFKTILDAISDPINNGGFTVNWPDYFYADDGKLPTTLEGNYFNLTWMIKDRFDFSDYNPSDNYEKALTIYGNHLQNIDSNSVMFGEDVAIDTTGYKSPKAQLSFNINIPYPSNIETDDTISFNSSIQTDLGYWDEGEGEGSYSNWINTGSATFNSFIEVYIEYLSSTGEDKTIRYILTTNSVSGDYEVYRKKYFPDLDENYFEGCIFKQIKFTKNTSVQRFINSTAFQVVLSDIAKDENFYINVGQVTHCTRIDKNFEEVWVKNGDLDKYKELGYTFVTYIDDDGNEREKVKWDEEFNSYYLMQGFDIISNTSYDNIIPTSKSSFIANVYTLLDDNAETNYVSVIYDTTPTSVQNVNIDKKLLFQNTKSPLDYLLTFCKMFNLKFLYDRKDNSINIVEAVNYYTGRTNNITDKINRTADMEIVPNFYDTKVYKYQLPSSDTYLEYLCRKKTGKEYCSRIYNTRNNVLSGITDVCEDFAFNTVGDFALSSVYFEDYLGRKGDLLSPQLGSSVLKGNECTLKLFKDNELNTEDFPAAFNKSVKRNDPIPKLCMFDNDNKPVDNICLVFLNTCINFNSPIRQGIAVTDNLPVMYELNGNPCYIDFYGTRNTGTTTGTTSIKAHTTGRLYYIEQKMPYFSPYMFATKQSTSGAWNLSDGRINYSGNNLTTTPHAICSTLFTDPKLKSNSEIEIDDCMYVFEYYWLNYYRDWFSRNNKEVTCSVMLDNKKAVSEMMRDFYYFDNCLWAINKITDIDLINRKPTKCTFIKIGDKNNYLVKNRKGTADDEI